MRLINGKYMAILGLCLLSTQIFAAPNVPNDGRSSVACGTGSNVVNASNDLSMYIPYGATISAPAISKLNNSSDLMSVCVSINFNKATNDK